ncbi:protein ALP1-like isoform X3 [Bradysia coprophila]|uniref:protein ALP1-like isoform X3 n=1 Tax=Bradysia coprophila TaxID=38358 RepID=UPI00187D7A43|nr:protein ALP1-like isoform X3 [Bradysia coprophila]
MTEKREKFVNNCFRVLTVLDQLDKIDDSDRDINDSLVKCKRIRENCVVEVEPAASGQLAGQSERKRCTTSNPTKGLMDGQNPLEVLSNEQFTRTYRFSKECVEDILQIIAYGLTKFTNRGKPFSPVLQLLITLQFLTTGTFKTKKKILVSQPTISRTIKKVTSLLSESRLRFIKIPDRAELKSISASFSSNGQFPEVFGCIGSTHIAIKSPGKSISDGYFNESGFYSFRVFMACGPDLQFYELISRWPGATQENKIFNISEIHQKFQFNQLEGILLADHNYPASNLIPFVMTPVDPPRNVQDCMYNDSHKRTYNIEKAVKLWKQRFKCLQTVLNNKEDTTQSIIQATAVLHNIAIQRKQPVPSENFDFL